MDSRSLPRRRHSAELKSAVLRACAEPGASVAAIALAQGLNANLVHRWRRDRAQATAPAAGAMVGEFVALPLPGTLPVVQPVPASTPSDIRVEVRRGAMTANISWPVHAASDCAAWLRELLR